MQRRMEKEILAATKRLKTTRVINILGESKGVHDLRFAGDTPAVKREVGIDKEKESEKEGRELCLDLQ